MRMGNPLHLIPPSPMPCLEQLSNARSALMYTFSLYYGNVYYGNIVEVCPHY
jgi:hypothetical protein